MMVLNKKILNKIVERVSDELEGDWIVIGGTVLPLIGVDYRVTVDVDLIPFGVSSNQSQLDLMNIAADLKLPVETINQAGGFFLQKVHGWKKMVALLRKGKKGSVFRPNLKLFFILKLGRISISDMQDCLEYFKWCKKNEEVPLKELVQLIQSELKKKPNEEKKERLATLLKVIHQS